MDASPTQIVLNLAGGVALLVWGARTVQTGITQAWGAQLRGWIGGSTRNPISALLIGLGITGILQSSTATAVLTYSFIRQGVMSTGAALAIMLGADVGTTLVVQVLTFDLSWLSPLLIFGGVVGFMSTSSSSLQNKFQALIGLGLLLLALSLIGVATEPMREGKIIRDIFTSLDGEWLVLILLGAVTTWMAHSSLAVVLLVLSLTGAYVITLEHGLVLVVGANLGAVLPQLTLAMRSGPVVRRIPMGNLLFKVAGAVLALAFMPWIGQWLAHWGVAEARQIAHFHTGFNLALAVLFIPIMPIVTRLLTRMLPEPPEGDDSAKPRYLDQAAKDSPGVALAFAARETLRMGEVVERMLSHAMRIFGTGEPRLMAEIEAMDDVVDRLHKDIKMYVAEITQAKLGEEDSLRGTEILSFVINLEHIGDIIDKNLMDLANKKIKHNLSFSSEGWEDLERLHKQLEENFRLAFGVFISKDVAMARQLLTEKIHFRDLERIAAESHLNRLRTRLTRSIDTSTIHLDILNEFKRINSHITSVAYPILEDAGELFSSRLKPRK